MSTDLRVSTLVENQFPEFAREEGPKLVAFIKAYYEWMETTGQVIDASKNILNNQDIDHTVDQFIDYFSREVMCSIPQSVLADKRLLVKNIQDFYKVKGTENSYKLLFRILYNEEIDLYYPGQDILRVSDGRWQFEKILYLSEPTNGNIYDLGGQVITGLTSGATAKVDKVLSSLKNGVIVFECYISNISGNFIDTEIVRNSTGSISGAAVSDSGSIVRVVVDQSRTGTGHLSGDRVSFLSTSGTGANGYVISVSNTGGILAVGVDNRGNDYNRVDTLTIQNLDRVANNAFGYPITTAIVSNPGRYVGTKGFISWNNKIQDSNYYQEYSYVLRSENVISKYRELVKNLVHPSGNILFGEVSIRIDADVSADIIREYVYNSSVSNIDMTYVAGALESEHVEVIESDIFAVQSPTVTPDITKYVIVLEPIYDNVSDLDINVEYINDVDYNFTIEIYLEPIESTAVVSSDASVTPTLTLVSFGPGRWVRVSDINIITLSSNTISEFANITVDTLLEFEQVGTPTIEQV